MGVVQCQRGHFYDDRKYMKCPYCEQNADDDSVTVRMTDEVIDRKSMNLFIDKAMKYEGDFDEEKTVSIFSKEKGNDFVTGWLVCVSGPEKGRSWELRYGFNRISRSNGSRTDISIEEDKQITRGCHCSVVYEYNKNIFYLVPEEGNLVYLGGEFLGKPSVLQTGDVFKIGNSELEFIAFCRGDRKWEK